MCSVDSLRIFYDYFFYEALFGIYLKKEKLLSGVGRQILYQYEYSYTTYLNISYTNKKNE